MNKQTISIIIVLVIALAAVFVIFQDNNSPKDEQHLETQQQEETIAPAETDNDKIPEFSMPDTNGKNVSIMDEIAKNRITIIDFWASWCGPCINEMPNIKSIYNQHKGIGIIGISLDSNRNEWQTAIEKLEMNWVQLSDLRGWDNEAARLFNVNSIPYTIVVSQDGTILATGLRGKSLKDFINNRMAESHP